MTVLLFALSGVAAAAGTRLAAPMLIATAVFGARGGDLAALSTWTAVTGAGWLLLTTGPTRTLALPALATAAVLAAGGAPNGAVVLGLWILGTLTAVVDARGAGGAGRAWSMSLLVTDGVFAAAIASTVARGFEGWPATLGTSGAWVVLAAAVTRIPLAAGPDDRSLAGVLVVRAQCVVLLSVALDVGSPVLTDAVIVLAAAGFAAASLFDRRATVDAVQELALVGLAVASSKAGWGPEGWAWGALAAGTLMHQLRFMSHGWKHAHLADLLGRVAGCGLPFLPIVLVELEGSFKVRGWVGVAVLLGLLGGMAGRARLLASPESLGEPLGGDPLGGDPLGPEAPQRQRLGFGAIVVVAVVVAGLWAPSLALPHPPGGVAVRWPPGWIGMAVAAIALGGSQISRLGEGPRSGSTPVGYWWTARFGRPKRWLDHVSLWPAIWVMAGLLTTAALVLWLVGVSRGFL